MLIMARPIVTITLIVTFFAAASAFAGDEANPQSVLDFTMQDIDGIDQPLSAYKGKVLMIVNVASKCGLTPQYEELEALYDKYGERGFAVLGFPANNFAGQEPGTNAEIKQFCTLNFGVKFPMFAKISVKGDDIHPLYTYLTSEKSSPFPGEIGWNFTKFIIGKDGKIISRFEPKTTPLSKEVINTVEKALAVK